MGPGHSELAQPPRLSLLSACYVPALLYLSLSGSHTHNPSTLHPHPHLRGAGHSPENRIPAQWWPHESAGPMAPSTWLQCALACTHTLFSLQLLSLSLCKVTGTLMTAAPRTDCRWWQGRNFGPAFTLHPKGSLSFLCPAQRAGAPGTLGFPQSGKGKTKPCPLALGPLENDVPSS